MEAKSFHSGLFGDAGLLLVGHGTRSEQGRAEFRETVELVAKLAPQVPVAAGFLELAEPTIDDAFDQLTDRGVRQIVVSPLLLFSAGHAKRDIPEAVQLAAERHPGVNVLQAEHLGCRDAMLQLSAERYQEAASDDDYAPQSTCWLMVGRGSRDVRATAEMYRFLQLRRRLTPVHRAAAAFLAMADPPLDQVLEETAALEFRRVIVQPHLLFHGELAGGLERRIEEIASAHPGQKWVLANYLGPTRLLAEAIFEAAAQTLSEQPA